MPYKQIYFPIRGRAEALRLVCVDNGLELIDEAVGYDDWLKLKPNTIFGQLPVYYDGDLELAQSVAFLRHLARKHGLYGANDVEATLIDMISDGQEDLRQKYIKLIYHNYDEGKEAYIKELPAELEKFEKLLKKNDNGQGFFVGKKISFVDYLLFDQLDNHVILTPTALDRFPALKGFYDRIAARPAIHQYRQTEAHLKRPVNGNGKQ